MNYFNQDFWNAIDKLIIDSQIVIDRHKGSHHPKYYNVVYPIDYGYLGNTSSMDGNGIDIWIGSLEKPKVDALICVVDLLKKDSEIKLIFGCNDDEKKLIYQFHNQSEFMKGIFINRRSCL